MIKSYPSVLLFKITLYPKSLWSSVVGFTMPISADQWRSVVGSNNARRPRQIGLKCFLITNQPLTCITPCRMYAERKQPSATDSGYLSHKSIVYVNYLALLLCLIMSVFHNTILNSGSSTQNFFLGKYYIVTSYLEKLQPCCIMVFHSCVLYVLLLLP